MVFRRGKSSLWRGTDLNRQPMAYESIALPIELPRLADKVYYSDTHLSTFGLFFNNCGFKQIVGRGCIGGLYPNNMPI